MTLFYTTTDARNQFFFILSSALHFSRITFHFSLFLTIHFPASITGTTVQATAATNSHS